MCCFPLTFSDLTVKVMRDGDGDGRCQEEDGKWVPCPPGVASGTRLRNGKPLGQTIAEMASTPATKPAKKKPDNNGQRQIQEDELKWFDETPMPQFREWKRLFGDRVEPAPDIDINDPAFWSAQNSRNMRLFAEYEKLEKEAAKRKRESRAQRIRQEEPDFFNEDGTVKEEYVAEYLARQREAAKRFAEKVTKAQTEVSPESRRAARTLGPFWLSGGSGRDEAEVLEEYERYYPRPERDDYPEGPEGEEDFDDDMSTWETNRDDFVYSEMQSDDWDVSDDIKAKLKQAFGHTFKGKSGRTYRVELYGFSRDTGVVSIQGRIVADDGSGRRPMTVADFSRSFGDVAYGEEAVYHDSLSVDSAYQGDGIATTFNAMNEAIYAEMGLPRIMVTGASGGAYTGGSHWPASGFNWTQDSKEQFLRTIEAAISDPSPDLFASEAEREILQSLIEAARNQDENFDEDRITASDLIRWRGATEYFRNRSITLGYERWID